MQNTKQSSKNSDNQSVAVQALQKQIVELTQKLGETELSYKRAMADYANLQRRTQEDQLKFAKFATASVLQAVLEPLDHLRTAAAHFADKSLGMILSQFDKMLEQEGIKEMNIVNTTFDPKTMEAIDSVPGKKDVVIQVVQKGYTLNGEVLRVAKVQVGNGEEVTQVQKNKEETA